VWPEQRTIKRDAGWVSEPVTCRRWYLDTAAARELLAILLVPAVAQPETLDYLEVLLAADHYDAIHDLPEDLVKLADPDEPFRELAALGIEG